MEFAAAATPVAAAGVLPTARAAAAAQWVESGCTAAGVCGSGGPWGGGGCVPGVGCFNWGQ